MSGGLAPEQGGWFDSHCHLQEKYLEGGEGDANEAVTSVLGRASGAGVSSLVCVGTDAATSSQALALARAARSGSLGTGMPAIWATAGLHPHEASSGTVGLLGLLEESTGAAGGAESAGAESAGAESAGAESAGAESAGDGGREAGGDRAGGQVLVAIGECGLDYHYDRSPRDVQRTVFAEQIAMARSYDLALVIHVREAWDDLFAVLGSEGVPDRTVLHCFTGGPVEARRCLDAGMFVSFSGIVTFKNAPEVREAAALCPLDRLLVETDSPFLTPVPLRGKPNEPAFVPLVGAAVAGVKGIDAAEVASTSARAARAAFGL